jgi:DNA mismatch endonuclease (patch repair protein)
VDVFSREKRSEIMSRIHQPTRPEAAVHNWLKARHVRHRMYPRMEGRPDVWLADAGVAVFVDGCFWHCCPLHYRRPKSNQEFWAEHVEAANRRREAGRAALPYRWVRIWEHDVRSGEFRRILGSVLGGRA